MVMDGQSSAIDKTDKRNFFGMLSAVQDKLHRLPADSLLKEYFPQARLDAIRRHVENNSASELEWGYWQPYFLFLRDQRDREGDRPWRAGLFEIFAKSTLVTSDLLSCDELDWLQSNGRDIDAKVTVGPRVFGVECMTLGESDATRQEWQEHCELLQTDPAQSFFVRQDAYTQGRRLYQAVYNKLAPKLDTRKSQLCQEGANLLLVSLSANTSDLSPDTLSIGWALDELFSDQPNGNRSPLSLEGFLTHRKTACSGAGAVECALHDLLQAPKQISGILLFSGCRLEKARINYNAHHCARISHEEMSLFERALSRQPAYDSLWWTKTR